MAASRELQAIPAGLEADMPCDLATAAPGSVLQASSDTTQSHCGERRRQPWGGAL